MLSDIEMYGISIVEFFSPDFYIIKCNYIKMFKKLDIHCNQFNIYYIKLRSQPNLISNTFS
jgi:hypothetical protein